MVRFDWRTVAQLKSRRQGTEAWLHPWSRSLQLSTEPRTSHLLLGLWVQPRQVCPCSLAGTPTISFCQAKAQQIFLPFLGLENTAFQCYLLQGPKMFDEKYRHH
jgi:hypothetical protein